MENLLTRKLERFAPLSGDDRALVDEVVIPSRLVPARSDLIREGQTSETVRLILFELPLTQADIGDTVGLSYVHVNRCVQTLRDMGMITIKNRAVVINDLDHLMRYTSFNPNYLHLDSVQRVD